MEVNKVLIVVILIFQVIQIIGAIYGIGLFIGTFKKEMQYVKEFMQKCPAGNLKDEMAKNKDEIKDDIGGLRNEFKYLNGEFEVYKKKIDMMCKVSGA